MRNQPDHLIDGGVTVGVNQYLPAVGVGLAHHRQRYGVVGKDRTAAVTGLFMFRGLDIGLGEPGSLALRRAVKGELYTAQTQVTPVVVRHQRAGEYRAVEGLLQVRIDHQVQLEQTGLGGLLHAEHGIGGGAAFLHCSEAVGQINLLGPV